MNKRAWLKNITIKQSPGFTLGEFPPLGKLGSSLNVIWGPNAVGKSTLSRAMRSLIWETVQSKEIIAEGELETPDSMWSLSISRGDLEQIRIHDNQHIPLIGRNDELSESYWFTLHEMLQEVNPHTRTFLDEVRKQMQGGIDIIQAAQVAGGFEGFSRGTLKEAKEVKDTSQKVDDVMREQARHQNIQEEIKDLEKEVNEYRVLLDQQEDIKKALSLITLLEGNTKIEEKLAQYHPSIQYINRSSYEQYEHKQKNVDDMSDRIKNTTITIDQYKTNLSHLSISEKDLSGTLLTQTVDELFETYEKDIHEKETRESEERDATSALDEWEKQHRFLNPEGIEIGELSHFLQTLKDLASECEPIRCSLDATKRFLSLLGKKQEIPYNEKDLTKLSFSLSSYIDTWGSLEKTPEFITKSSKISTIISLSIIVVASILGFLVHTSFSYIGGIILFLLLLITRPRDKKNSEFSRFQEELVHKREAIATLLDVLNIEQPSSWEIDKAKNLLSSIEAEILLIKNIVEQNQRIDNGERELEKAQRSLQEWTQSWKSAVDSIGLSSIESRLEGAQFFHFSDRLQTWSNLKIQKEKCSARVVKAKIKEQESLFALQKELNTKESQYPKLKAIKNDLKQRFLEAKNTQKAISEKESQLAHFQKEYKTLYADLISFWESTRLTFGDTVTLQNLSDQVENWEQDTRAYTFNKNSYTKTSSENPIAYEKSKDMSIEELQRELQSIEEKLENINTKREALGGLKNTYERLTHSSDLSEAELAKSKAIKALEEVREREVMGNMIDFIAKDVQKESERKFHPIVLTRASEWLGKITLFRYTIGAQKDSFFVTDTIINKNYTVNELSSATRVQLLLSIRLAFITLQEEMSGVHLPIFFDEILANSDDDRAQAIIQGIAEIAKERQVFYFTAQRDEVEKLRAIGSKDITIIPLEDITREYHLTNSSIIPFKYKKKSIPPLLENYFEYGKTLNVLTPSLWDPIESLHSWYLYNSSDELYRYLSRGLATIGQIIASGETSIEKRVSLLKEAQRITKIGRSRLLHIEDLSDPSLDINRKARSYDQMRETIGIEGISGRELLDAIQGKRIQRVQATTFDNLSDWLLSHEFIAEESPLDTEDIINELFPIMDRTTVDPVEQEIVERWLHIVLLS